MLLTRRFFPSLLIGLLLFTGVAQAQTSPSGTNPQNSEMKADGGKYLQPFQPCLNVDQDQKGSNGSLQEQTHQSLKTVNVPLKNTLNSQDITKAAVGTKNPVPKSDLLKPSFKNKSGSTTQDMGQQVSTVGGLPTIPVTAQSSGLGSSFLNGYLLQSPQEKGLGRKREAKEKESKGGLSWKKGTKGQESPDDLRQKRVKKAY